MDKKTYGFTIVELLIVIVVIGILATISVISYTDIVAKANDSRMRDGAAKFVKALQLWGLDNGRPSTGNWGSTVAISGNKCADGSGGGFVASGTYLCTAEDMLIASDLLPAGFVSKLPKNKYITYTNPTTGMLSLMIYSCGSNSSAVYWTLEKPTPQDTASFNQVAGTCGMTGLRDNYGMQAAQMF